MPLTNGESSSTDSDDEFSEDMEALRRACQITGINPTDPQFLLPSTTGSVDDGDALSESEADEEDLDDDLEILRNIQKRFADPTDMEEPLSLKPLFTMRPDWSDDDDCADDFETLRAIQRRFAAYDGRMKDEEDDIMHGPMQVGATVINSEKESSNSLFVERTNAPERFLNCVDESEHTGQHSEAFNDAGRTKSSDLVGWDGPGADDLAELPLKNSQFPKSAHAFVDAIKKNRCCQKLIRNKMMYMEARIEELKKLTERVKILKDFQVACKRRTGRALSLKRDPRMQLISVSKQRANSKVNENNVPAIQKGPPENPHVAIYKEALAAFPVYMTRSKWSKEEKENLLKGLRQQFQEMLLQRSVDLLSDPDVSSGDISNFDSIIGTIKDLDITPEKIRGFLPKVNWEQLAAMYVPGRSGAECQARFLNCDDPLINHNPWTAIEDKNLLHIIQQKGLSNWIDIAASLGTNRTPFQCLARYQRSLNASILKREWTKEEDNQLRSAVEIYGESDWQLVASAVEGRTGTQCSNRWLKTLNPARKRVGKWTAEEDKRLRVAVTLFGPKTWKKVANCVPGRTQVQCRERWVNCLDPSLNMSKWTEEEDSKLEEAIAEHGHCWSKVAACIPHRTDNQCWRRWKVLFPNEVPVLRAARKIQKAALISNFVDRESERPALGPNDFIPPESKHVDSSQAEKKKSRRTAHKRIGKYGSSGKICSDEVPKLTNCSEVDNMDLRLIQRKGRRNGSYSTKKKAGPSSCSGDVQDGKSMRRCRQKKKRSGVKAESMDHISALGPSRNRKRSAKRCGKEYGDSDPTDECTAPLIDPNVQSVVVGEDEAGLGSHGASQIKRTSKLQSRHGHGKLLVEVAETVYDKEMRAFDDNILKMKKTKKEKKQAYETDDRLSSFPDSMSLMDIRRELESGRRFKANNKKRNYQETCSGSDSLTPAAGQGRQTLPQSHTNKDRRVTFVGEAEMASNQHFGSEIETAVSVGSPDDNISSQRDDRLQHIRKVNLPTMIGSSSCNSSEPSVKGASNCRDSSFGCRDTSKSSSAREIEEEDINLASLRVKSHAQKKPHLSEAVAVELPREMEKELPRNGQNYEAERSLASNGVITYTRKRRRGKDEVSRCQMVEVESGLRNDTDAALKVESEDDTTLSHLFTKLKRRKTGTL